MARDNSGSVQLGSHSQGGSSRNGFLFSLLMETRDPTPLVLVNVVSLSSRSEFRQTYLRKMEYVDIVNVVPSIVFAEGSQGRSTYVCTYIRG